MEKFGEPKRTAPSVTPDHRQPSSATSGKPLGPQHSACSPFSRGDTPVSMLHSRHQGRQAVQTRSVGPKARGAGCTIDGTDHHDKAGVVEEGPGKPRSRLQRPLLEETRVWSSALPPMAVGLAPAALPTDKHWAGPVEMRLLAAPAGRGRGKGTREEGAHLPSCRPGWRAGLPACRSARRCSAAPARRAPEHLSWSRYWELRGCVLGGPRRFRGPRRLACKEKAGVSPGRQRSRGREGRGAGGFRPKGP